MSPTGSPHPHLRPAPEPSAGEGERARRPLRWLPIALAVALLVCAGGWLQQARQASRLEAELAASRAAQVAAEARVDALEGHLGSVRDRFASLRDTLQDELESLGALLTGDPAQ